MNTKARFLEYTDKICRDSQGIILDGDELLENQIMRFSNGLLHAEDEPAIACSDGHLEWWQNGRLHREDGPAVQTIREDENGEVYGEWWQNGERVES